MEPAEENTGDTGGRGGACQKEQRGWWERRGSGGQGDAVSLGSNRTKAQSGKEEEAEDPAPRIQHAGAHADASGQLCHLLNGMTQGPRGQGGRPCRVMGWPRCRLWFRRGCSMIQLRF